MSLLHRWRQQHERSCHSTLLSALALECVFDNAFNETTNLCTMRTPCSSASATFNSWDSHRIDTHTYSNAPLHAIVFSTISSIPQRPLRNLPGVRRIMASAALLSWSYDSSQSTPLQTHCYLMSGIISNYRRRSTSGIGVVHHFISPPCFLLEFDVEYPRSLVSSHLPPSPELRCSSEFRLRHT